MNSNVFKVLFMHMSNSSYINVNTIIRDSVYLLTIDDKSFYIKYYPSHLKYKDVENEYVTQIKYRELGFNIPEMMLIYNDKYGTNTIIGKFIEEYNITETILVSVNITNARRIELPGLRDFILKRRTNSIFHYQTSPTIMYQLGRLLYADILLNYKDRFVQIYKYVNDNIPDEEYIKDVYGSLEKYKNNKENELYSSPFINEENILVDDENNIWVVNSESNLPSINKSLYNLSNPRYFYFINKSIQEVFIASNEGMVEFIRGINDMKSLLLNQMIIG